MKAHEFIEKISSSPEKEVSPEIKVDLLDAKPEELKIIPDTIESYHENYD